MTERLSLISKQMLQPGVLNHLYCTWLLQGCYCKSSKSCQHNVHGENYSMSFHRPISVWSVKQSMDKLHDNLTGKAFKIICTVLNDPQCANYTVVKLVADLLSYTAIVTTRFLSLDFNIRGVFLVDIIRTWFSPESEEFSWSRLPLWRSHTSAEGQRCHPTGRPKQEGEI